MTTEKLCRIFIRMKKTQPSAEQNPEGPHTVVFTQHNQDNR